MKFKKFVAGIALFMAPSAFAAKVTGIAYNSMREEIHLTMEYNPEDQGWNYDLELETSIQSVRNYVLRASDYQGGGERNQNVLTFGLRNLWLTSKDLKNLTIRVFGSCGSLIGPDQRWCEGDVTIRFDQYGAIIPANPAITNNETISKKYWVYFWNLFNR